VGWRRDEVWAYIRGHGLDYHALYERGYASIGCAPCTRPIEPGEDERAGRWWWEQSDVKECGLHLTEHGLVRAKREN
jgi:phosphoadenosine phosphosulfate reductase